MRKKVFVWLRFTICRKNYLIDLRLGAIETEFANLDMKPDFISLLLSIGFNILLLMNFI